jgi:hypothetical protein
MITYIAWGILLAIIFWPDIGARWLLGMSVIGALSIYEAHQKKEEKDES